MAKSPKRSGDVAKPDTPSAAEIEAIIHGTHGDPFAFLGVHEAGTGHVARCFIPGAETVFAYNLAGEQIGELARLHDAGFFSGSVKLDGVASKDQLLATIEATIRAHDVLRLKGFAALPGASARLAIQAVGQLANSLCLSDEGFFGDAKVIHFRP